MRRGWIRPSSTICKSFKSAKSSRNGCPYQPRRSRIPTLGHTSRKPAISEFIYNISPYFRPSRIGIKCIEGISSLGLHRHATSSGYAQQPRLSNHNEPKSFLLYYPALVHQSEITQQVSYLGSGHSVQQPITIAGAPVLTKPLGQRQNFDPVANDILPKPLWYCLVAFRSPDLETRAPMLILAFSLVTRPCGLG